MPHLRHHRARQRPAGGRPANPQAALLAKGKTFHALKVQGMPCIPHYKTCKVQRPRNLIPHVLQEESELTMCTDVDRNDKSRICVPGSVKVLGRRQIELYSKLIHTVDHVEGYLREGFDGE